jgi:putative ABC transport system substrate-binding protein
MRRREFIAGIGAATAWPFIALAQKPDRTRRIGVLMSLGENDPEGKAQLSGFTKGLADLGWSDGLNLRIDARWGGGDVNNIRTFAKELVAMQPDLIVAQGTPVTAALQRETRTIPIVFVVVTDPIGEGFVEGLARPGGNITGFITSEAAMGSKMLDLLISPPTSGGSLCCSIPIPLLAAGNIISAISKLLPDPPECNRSLHALRTMLKLKPS